MEVVGTANNGKIALAKLDRLKPDILTLDFEMPEMDGLATLRALKKEAPGVAAIMVSNHTQIGAKATLEALDLGAFDFIAKPNHDSLEKNIESLRSQLRPMILNFRNKRHIAEMLRGQGKPAVAAPSQDIVLRMAQLLDGGRLEIVAIGISTGGPNALAAVLPFLPKDLGVPLVIVQHMPPVFTAALAESLDKKCNISVSEGKNGEVLEINRAYLAPGGKHMRLELHPESRKPCLIMTDDPPENHCRPSVDYLFRSVAKIYEGRALGIIMTGMGSDGTLGLKAMKSAGAKTLAQDEGSCVVFGMPLEAIKAGSVDTVLPLDQIASEIVRLVKKCR